MNSIQLMQEPAGKLLMDTSSVQVKMFVHNNPKDAERSVGQWLKENDVILHHIVQSQSEKSGSFVFVITVFYLPTN